MQHPVPEPFPGQDAKAKVYRGARTPSSRSNFRPALSGSNASLNYEESPSSSAAGATSSLLASHTELAATVVGSAKTGLFHHHRKFWCTALC